jgi:dTDP-6-deoxy-L-talose 4-dehydrogenase (NAD+)
MTKITVTGASGFVGRHVLAALSQGAADVVAHARSPQAAHKTAPPRWVTFDLADPPADAFELLGRPDIVIHLAWGGLPNYLASRHVDVEFPAQRRFLWSLLNSGLKRLVVSGTCFEYGMQSGKLHEDMAPLSPTAYGVAKDMLRRELVALQAEAPFDLRWLRLFYLYGDGQAPTSLYSLFRAAVARRDKIFDMSPGDQQRDFMKAEDVGRAIAAVALAPKAPDIVNICSGKPTSVRSLVEQWRADMGADIGLRFGVLGYPAYEPFAFWGDDSRLAALPQYTAVSGRLATSR